jgi:hypothetical protein
LFKENKYPVPQIFNGKLKDYFKGYRNQIADLKLNGELKGKAHYHKHNIRLYAIVHSAVIHI